ncbi:RNA 2'-phosphotransferase [Haladaptatus sp. CMAA 1911]|uniref:RNA 2'-phosphotransferase n=1 Tax=unclassified Haladaptatus TaxID=2622732 RepID=UPI0037542BAD
MVRTCDDHGFFVGESCPVCGDAGEEVIGENRRVRLSKFMSGVLRHFPADVGLTLNTRGWVDYDEFVDAVTDKYPWARPQQVAAVVATDSKGRFERRDDRIRAVYGHSVDVSVESTTTDVPNRLYHGTAPRNLDGIAEEGLKPMGRQQVHLSKTPREALAVGGRHADEPVVLVIDSETMTRDGFEIDKRGHDTYTVDAVPPEYIERRDVSSRTGQ